MKKLLIAGAVLLAAGIGARVRFVSARDTLTAQREAVADAWNAVEAALREHAEILPALQAQIKVAPKLEAQVQQTISEARAVLDGTRPVAEKLQAYTRLSRETARLLLAGDEDSSLRKNRNLTVLRDELAGSDNRIRVARRKYNEALERYNASLSVFPNNVVAAISGFSRNDAYFPTSVELRLGPKE